MSFLKGIQGRFLLFFLVMDCLTLGALTYSVTTTTRGALVSQIEERLSITARNVSREVTGALRTRYLAVKRLSREPVLAFAIQHPDELKGAIAELNGATQPAVTGNPSSANETAHGIAKLTLLTDRGDIVLQTGAPSAEFRTPAWLDQVTETADHTEILVSGGAPRILFSCAVLEHGVKRGVLVAEFDLGFIDLIAARDPSFKTILLGPQGELYRGEVSPAVARRLVQAGFPWGVSRLLEEDTNYYVVAASPELPGVRWDVVLSAPIDAVLKPVSELQKKLVQVGALTGLILAFLVLFYLRRVVRPLQNLERTMNTIMERRSLKERAVATTRDEVGALAATFNRLLESLSQQSERLQESHRELEFQRSKSIDTAKMAALGEMAGGLAHEINTPLAVINLSAGQALEQLETEPGDLKTLRKLMERIETTSQRIARIVKGMRSFSRQAGDDPHQLTPVETLLEETLTLCQERFRYHSITMTLEPFPPGLTVLCRPTQVQQVILNLLNNAHDAVENRAEKWVRIGIMDEGENVKFTITDSGDGIPVAMQTRIFQPFFTTKEVGRGTGLGLSISKGILEEHHGSIAINPQCPNTQFVIRLPKAGRASDSAAA